MEITTQILLWSFAAAFVLGGVANKTNFCTMGAVSDWINIGDLGRLRAWFLAIAVALTGALIIEAQAVVDLNESRVPYRSSTFVWPRYILGGLMFGIGMTLCSGCGNKNLVRLGGGSLKSVVVILVAGIMAYLMTKTDFYGVVFHSWMVPISPDLAASGIDNQALGTVAGSALGINNFALLQSILGGLIALGLLYFVFKSSDFRASFDNIVGGLVVGAVILGGWYVTGGPLGQSWLEEVEFMDQPPPGAGVQSYTFINPMGEALVYMSNPSNVSLITFGVAAFFGVIAGSFAYALLTGHFRLEWFSSFSDFVRHIVGGVMIGIGGVLALGCTLGQGVTGFSTLAVGSMLALVSIILGAALSMKVQYYKMVYEKDARFVDALVTALADLHLIPNKMRRLEAV